MIYWKFACRKYYMYWKWQSLLSIKKLTLARYETRLTVNTAIIRLDDDNIAEAKEYRNTCKLKVHLCDHINAITKFTNNPNFKLWYHRLWHHKWKAIKKPESENLITGLKIKGQKEENITHECCIQGKMTTKPCSKVTQYKAQSPSLMIISTVLWHISLHLKVRQP